MLLSEQLANFELRVPMSLIPVLKHIYRESAVSLDIAAGKVTMPIMIRWAQSQPGSYWDELARQHEVPVEVMRELRTQFADAFEAMSLLVVAWPFLHYSTLPIPTHQPTAVAVSLDIHYPEERVVVLANLVDFKGAVNVPPYVALGAIYTMLLDTLGGLAKIGFDGLYAKAGDNTQDGIAKLKEALSGAFGGAQNPPSNPSTDRPADK